MHGCILQVIFTELLKVHGPIVQSTLAKFSRRPVLMLVVGVHIILTHGVRESEVPTQG